MENQSMHDWPIEELSHVSQSVINSYKFFFLRILHKHVNTHFLKNFKKRIQRKLVGLCFHIAESVE